LIKATIYFAIVALMIALIISFPNTAPNIGMYTDESPAGVFSGVWHGSLVPGTLILSIINSQISIYETSNSGWWYDFGFYLAMIIGIHGTIHYFKSKK